MAYFSPGRLATMTVMNSIDDFEIASFEKKCELVTTKTHYITSRIEDDKKVYLYHSGKFFVEVYYAPSVKRVLFIHAFNDVKTLVPYTESVSLDDIMV